MKRDEMSGLFGNLTGLPAPVRMAIVATLHAALFATAYIAAFAVRFDLSIPPAWEPVIWEGLVWIVGVKFLIFGLFRMYQGWWRYVSLYDLLELTRALVIACALYMALCLFAKVSTPPRSIYVLDFGISLVLLGGARGSMRLLRESLRAYMPSAEEVQNVLILGAGDTGETLLREIGKNPNLPYRVVGFLDDAPSKRGLKIQNAMVLGPIESIEEQARKHDISMALIAMPSASRDQLRRVVELCKAAQVEVKILPAVETMLSHDISVKQLREVSISDLLGRAPVKLDMQSIGRFLQGRRVLVTGAGGSIGSELCRQVLRFAPSELVMVEMGETPLFFIHKELRAAYGEELLVPYVSTICDRDRMREIFAKHEPEVILHAAAYKHVPLMEFNPCEAVKNNIGGTQAIAELASEFGVGTFVLISTDKAVNPTSVMGATKRVTELLIMAIQRRQENQTRFCAVRFGNVLGSNGSVVPIFTEQIKRGGPVTVTHPEMTRYFMTIPEAVQLVLQAGAFGEGGEIFILDMGEPVKIADLARDMIRLSGLGEEEIEVIYSGIRPGEKLFEELAINADELDTTRHAKIFVAPKEVTGLEDLEAHRGELLEQAHRGNAHRVRVTLKELIPTYVTPSLRGNVISLHGDKDAGEGGEVSSSSSSGAS